MPLLSSHAAAAHAPRPHGRQAMDRVIGWLDAPARRLHHMLMALPGMAPLRHVSLSLHDPLGDSLWSFAVSRPAEERLMIEEVALRNTPSLALLMDEDDPRIVGDLGEFGEDARLRSTGATAEGCRSCMTVPVHHEGAFLGFVVFGAAQPHFFRPEAAEILSTYAEAYAILITRALEAVGGG